jgi:intracellular sulfur oxidation DsrE/DsrF family protein
MSTRPSDFEGMDQANVVWDFFMGDGSFFHNRLLLIKDSFDSFSEWGITPNFFILIRGRATKFVAKSLSGTAFSEENIPELNDIHSVLDELNDVGVRIGVCKNALAKTSISEDNVASFASPEAHAVKIGIALQSRGYAYMRIDAKPS